MIGFVRNFWITLVLTVSSMEASLVALGKVTAVVGSIADITADLASIAEAIDADRTIAFTISNNTPKLLKLQGTYIESGEFMSVPFEIQAYTSVTGGAQKKWGFYGVEGCMVYYWEDENERIAMYLENPYSGSNLSGIYRICPFKRPPVKSKNDQYQKEIFLPLKRPPFSKQENFQGKGGPLNGLITHVSAPGPLNEGGPLNGQIRQYYWQTYEDSKWYFDNVPYVNEGEVMSHTINEWFTIQSYITDANKASAVFTLETF